MQLKWTARKSNSSGWKYFYYYVDENNIGISVACHKVPIKGQPWTIEIAGYTIPNYTFEWHQRFDKDKVLLKVEDMIFGGWKPVLNVIFNRIFNSKEYND